MKSCPRCGAVAFDDALFCFGCLYRYEEGEQIAKMSLDDATLPLPESFDNDSPAVSRSNAFERKIPLHSGYALESQDPPEFCIHLIPRHNSWGGWKWDCSVEIAEKVKHEVVGRHALQVH